MKKYIVTMSYTCEAESELRAVFAMQKSLRPLSERELEKFEAIKVEETK